MSEPAVDADLAERLLARTLALVDVASESGRELAILGVIRSLLDGGYEVADDVDSVLFVVPEGRRDARPLVVLAGHVDTVPGTGNLPGRRDRDAVIGRGAADMKGSLAVMLELQQGHGGGDLDVGFLFFGREEQPISQSALLPLFDRSPVARTIDLAIMMEPTDNAIEVGCLGNLNALITVQGEAAHSARPWLGRNAIHTAIDALRPIATAPPTDVEIDGLVYREAVSLTGIEGGIAGNVVPDRVEVQVNLRYAPNRTPAEAEARLRELTAHPDLTVDVIANAPPGPVAITHPLVERLRRAGNLRIGPKQAWTPVAEFGMAGIDAVNFGPGDPQYAHRDDERIHAGALIRSIEVLRAFLAAQEGA